MPRHRVLIPVILSVCLAAAPTLAGVSRPPAARLAAAGLEEAVPRLEALAADGLAVAPGPALRDAIARVEPDPARRALLEEACLEMLGAQRMLRIGDVELSRADVLRIAGPRAGRDRADVVRRLLALPAAAHLTGEEALALVPQLARIADGADAAASLDRLALAIAGGERPR